MAIVRPLPKKTFERTMQIFCQSPTTEVSPRVKNLDSLLCSRTPTKPNQQGEKTNRTCKSGANRELPCTSEHDHAESHPPKAKRPKNQRLNLRTTKRPRTLPNQNVAKIKMHHKRSTNFPSITTLGVLRKTHSCALIAPAPSCHLQSGAKCS